MFHPIHFLPLLWVWFLIRSLKKKKSISGYSVWFFTDFVGRLDLVLGKFIKVEISKAKGEGNTASLKMEILLGFFVYEVEAGTMWRLSLLFSLSTQVHQPAAHMSAQDDLSYSSVFLFHSFTSFPSGRLFLVSHLNLNCSSLSLALPWSPWMWKTNNRFLRFCVAMFVRVDSSFCPLQRRLK